MNLPVLELFSSLDATYTLEIASTPTGPTISTLPVSFTSSSAAYSCVSPNAAGSSSIT